MVFPQLKLAHEDPGSIAARTRQASHIALLDRIKVERDEKRSALATCGCPAARSAGSLAGGEHDVHPARRKLAI